MEEVRVRFAPSPTGFLHIGGLRTALYDYLFARNKHGKVILRIEDTDQNRKVEGAVENLLESFSKLDIEFDEGSGIGGDFGPYMQSERLPIYHKHAQQLLDQGHAYRCFCDADTLDQMRKDLQATKQFPKYDRRCLALSREEIDSRIAQGDKFVIRLKMPEDRIFVINDLIRGKVEIDTSQLDDQVLIKSDGFPTYHLAAVVDDHLMKISHVIRGEEWLPSTPKHIFLYECFGWIAPLWVHLPLILNPDKSKLSKRMNDVSVDSYLDKGYLKEALINFVALLGWHGADDREIYSLDELCSEFSLERVNKSGSVFDVTKLDWMNSYYVKSLPLKYIADMSRRFFVEKSIDISDERKYQKVIEVFQPRVTLLSDFVSKGEPYFKDIKLSEKDSLVLKSITSVEPILYLLGVLDVIDINDTILLSNKINQGRIDLELKSNQYYPPLNIALSYSSSCPELHNVIQILGKEVSINRLNAALELTKGDAL